MNFKLLPKPDHAVEPSGFVFETCKLSPPPSMCTHVYTHTIVKVHTHKSKNMCKVEVNSGTFGKKNEISGLLWCLVKVCALCHTVSAWSTCTSPFHSFHRGSQTLS